MVRMYRGDKLYEFVDKAIENVDREIILRRKENADKDSDLYLSGISQIRIHLAKIKEACTKDNLIGDPDTFVGLDSYDENLIKGWNKEFSE